MKIDFQKTIKNTLKSLRLNEQLISTMLGGVVVMVVGILVYNYFASVNKTADIAQVAVTEGVNLIEEDGEFVPSDLPTVHTVAKGEYLWLIAEQYYESGYNWVDIARENNLSDADVVTEGQELVIPREGVIVLDKSELQEVMAETQETVKETTYTVVAGDTLWRIAIKVYDDSYQWTKIWEANKTQVPNYNLIEKEMVLEIPR